MFPQGAFGKNSIVTEESPYAFFKSAVLRGFCDFVSPLVPAWKLIRFRRVVSTSTEQAATEANPAEVPGPFEFARFEDDSEQHHDSNLATRGGKGYLRLVHGTMAIPEIRYPYAAVSEFAVALQSMAKHDPLFHEEVSWSIVARDNSTYKHHIVAADWIEPEFRETILAELFAQHLWVLEFTVTDEQRNNNVIAQFLFDATASGQSDSLVALVTTSEDKKGIEFIAAVVTAAKFVAQSPSIYGAFSREVRQALHSFSQLIEDDELEVLWREARA
jgi:hypothetical protein